MGGWFKKEINTIEDLKGLKMRNPGFAGEIMAAVGAKPINSPAGVFAFPVVGA
jgi:TRAP-type mannitol/chloroaromatic compound transport system substrate-binding protein